jgi:autotransporter translocation and assembly factor TamB
MKSFNYEFKLAMQNFTAVDPLYIATFDGDFVVSEGPVIHGQMVPFVWSDDVRLQRAVVFYDFTKPNEGALVEASTRPLQWVYDLHVKAKNNLRWTPSDADIEFDADLFVRQSPDTLLLFGDLHALRGWYDFLSTRFTITQANLTFDDVGGLDPLVDVIATTRFSAVPSSGTEASQRYTVTVTIQGRSKEPTIEFASDPATLDEARILQQITIGAGGGAGVAAGIGGSLDSYLTRQLNRQLSGEMQRVFRGYLNELEINREGGLFSGEGDVVMTVGGQIAPNLGLRYQQRITSGTNTEVSPVAQSDLFDRNIEAEYRLNRFISLTSGLVQRRATGSTASASPTSEYNVGLRARWEY